VRAGYLVTATSFATLITLRLTLDSPSHTGDQLLARVVQAAA
jgi:hypothetical protein